eukprot:CAMPEP_0117496618 /NCGR_PEP_ID=MMETSP0784-20121206/20752_1 /TAXON_ID=39447 /ORGANISM="" /LENGTH=211 /DNA_ID=CAMNT_0005291599 /DNA_START=65 /DNA_END=700 /DNA_ORIENTATION=-
MDLQPLPSPEGVVAAERRQDFSAMQRTFEGVQTGLALQSQRLDVSLERLARVEAEVRHVADLMVESESIIATEHRQRHDTLASLTRRMEDAILTCSTLQRGQEHISHRIDRNDGMLKDCTGNFSPGEVHNQRNEVNLLRGAVQQRIDEVGRFTRKLGVIEPAGEECRHLRREIDQVSKDDEMYDLELVAMRGQLDALSTLVRRRLAERQSK